VVVARPHRIVALLALAVVLLALAAAGIASAAAPDQRHYPPNVRSQFTSSCVQSAKRVAGANIITKAKATAYCRSALSCIERHLTLAQFVRLAQNLKAGRHDSHVSVMTSCERAAAKRVLG
jgi:hypothetical protein